MFLLFPSAFRKDWQNKYHQNGHQPCHYWHSHLKHQLCQSLPLCQCFCFPLLWGVFSERIVQHIIALNEYLQFNFSCLLPQKAASRKALSLAGGDSAKGGCSKGGDSTILWAASLALDQMVGMPKRNISCAGNIYCYNRYCGSFTA